MASTKQNMDQQVEVEGCPQGLQPQNVRIGMARKRNSWRSMSFNTLFSGSPTSSSDSSSNLDTQFQDNSVTLGSLIGVSSILELSRRAKKEVLKSRKCKKSKCSSWLFCLCSFSSSSDYNLDAESKPPSLGQFLALERRATYENRKNQIPHDHDEFSLTQNNMEEPNSLFINGSISSRQRCRQSGYGNSWLGSLADIYTCLFGHATPG